MRHDAVVMLGILAAAVSVACTEKLILPGAGPRGLDGGATGGGGGSSGGGRDAGATGGGSGSFGGRDGSGGSFGGDSRPPCGDVRLEMQRGRVVFSVGKNTSMFSKSFDGGTRFSSVQQALQSVIHGYEDSVIFGYQDFPGTTSCGMSGGCCIGKSIPPSSTAVGAIRAALECRDDAASKGCDGFSEYRPIATAFQKAVPFFKPTDFNPSGKAGNFLALIVDGDPSCGTEDAAGSCTAAVLERSVLGETTTTVVVGVGQEAASAPCLKNLAMQADQPLQLPDNTEALTGTLREIVRKAALPYCFINLETSTDPDTIALFIASDRPVPRNSPLGGANWIIVPNQPGLQIQVLGELCSQLQKTPSDFIDVWGCEKAP